MTDSPPKPPRPITRTLFDQEITTEQLGAAAPQPEQGEPVVRSAIPGVTESKMFFELFTFVPEETIPKAVLLEVLTAAKFVFDRKVFNLMSPEAQRQFLRLDRTGSLQRVRPEQNPTRNR